MYNKAEEEKRQVMFRRNRSLESMLRLLNDTLCCAEEQLLEKSSMLGTEYPLIFIVGPLRSGTTMFMQWLANSGQVAYPTNLLSRFYGAPILGAQIQLVLTDPRYNFRNEILDFNSPITYESENGKTKGALEPNEFWYFWRRFLPFQELDWLPDEELFRVVDKAKLVKELIALTQVFEKPFAMKCMILNYNIPFLDTIVRNAIFVQIKRDPVTNISSILEARRKQLGSESEWYSFKIPEYHELKEMDPITQVAGQLYYINKAVSRGISSVDESRKLTVQYEDFCRNPGHVYEELMVKLHSGKSGCEYHGPRQFRISRNTDVKVSATIEKALSQFSE